MEEVALLGVYFSGGAVCAPAVAAAVADAVEDGAAAVGAAAAGDVGERGAPARALGPCELPPCQTFLLLSTAVVVVVVAAAAIQVFVGVGVFFWRRISRCRRRCCHRRYRRRRPAGVSVAMVHVDLADHAGVVNQLCAAIPAGGGVWCLQFVFVPTSNFLEE